MSATRRTWGLPWILHNDRHAQLQLHDTEPTDRLDHQSPLLKVRRRARRFALLEAVALDGGVQWRTPSSKRSPSIRKKIRQIGRHHERHDRADEREHKGEIEQPLHEVTPAGGQGEIPPAGDPRDGLPE